MRLRLKEDPREWRKFLAVALVFVGLVTFLAWRRGWLPRQGVPYVLAPAALLGIAGAMRPHWVRPVYRAAMIFSHRVGGVVGKVLLALLFVAAIIPLGLLLRLAGRDLLERRRDPRAATYWRPPGRHGSLERMY